MFDMFSIIKPQVWIYHRSHSFCTPHPRFSWGQKYVSHFHPTFFSSLFLCLAFHACSVVLPWTRCFLCNTFKSVLLSLLTIKTFSASSVGSIERHHVCLQTFQKTSQHEYASSQLYINQFEVASSMYLAYLTYLLTPELCFMLCAALQSLMRLGSFIGWMLL